MAAKFVEGNADKLASPSASTQPFLPPCLRAGLLSRGGAQLAVRSAPVAGTVHGEASWLSPHCLGFRSTSLSSDEDIGSSLLHLHSQRTTTPADNDVDGRPAIIVIECYEWLCYGLLRCVGGYGGAWLWGLHWDASYSEARLRTFRMKLGRGYWESL